ncbi:MAG: VWA domain-containing protein [Bacteroidia bacterium]|nr:VWA domain-containing protein [Bacteroidia bacterium]
MKKLLICFLLTFIKTAVSQVLISENTLDLGEIKNIYEVKAEVILTNSGPKKIFLLKADTEKDMKVFSSKRTLNSNDTALLVISFIPENNGKFKKEIKLFTSDQNEAHKITVKGEISDLKRDDKTACFYFKKPKNNTVVTTEPLLVKTDSKPKDNSNKIPDNASEPIVTKSVEITAEPQIKQPEEDNSALPELLYKPNNIVFLVDVSNSMKDSLKLPLMKVALHHLIDAVRAVDKITFLTYADSVVVLAENIDGSRKEELHQLVDKIKARGLTKGRQAILKSTDIAIKHYINGGNNEILLATDGKFNFYEEDEKTFKEKQLGKPIVLSTVAFGSDKTALNNLKDISKKGNGSFILIKSRKQCTEVLLDEIKIRSLKNTAKAK